MTVYWVLLLITAFLAYLIGSLRSTVIAANFIFHRSFARMGHGGAWLFNFRRLYGVKGFIKLALVEIVKDLLPILVGGWLLGIKDHALVGRAFAGFCLVMGGLYPVFYGFRGGHGAIYLVMAALCVDLSLGIAAGAVMAAVTWFSRYVSLGTVAGALTYIGAAVLVLDDRLTILLCVFTALLVILKHIPAMLRLAVGREEKFVLKEDITYKFDEQF